MAVALSRDGGQPRGFLPRCLKVDFRTPPSPVVASHPKNGRYLVPVVPASATFEEER